MRDEVGELVCPGCGEPGRRPGLPVCPRDGRAFITRHAFEKGAGDPFLGARLEGGFVPLELAALGAGSAVYRGIDAAGEGVALKVTRLDGGESESALRSWQREVEALEGLPTCAFVSIRGAHRIEAPPAVLLAVEWLEGEGLRDRLARGPLELSAALRIGIEASVALSALHERGLVYADLKPTNAILEPSGRLRLFDLGSATREGERAETLTPLYAAPEQLRGEPLDRGADLYALGGLLFHLSTGAPPYGGAADAVRRAHLEGSPPAPSSRNPSLPPLVDEIVLALLRNRPGDRPRDAREVAAWLAEAVRATCR